MRIFYDNLGSSLGWVGASLPLRINYLVPLIAHSKLLFDASIDELEENVEGDVYYSGISVDSKLWSKIGIPPQDLKSHNLLHIMIFVVKSIKVINLSLYNISTLRTFKKNNIYGKDNFFLPHHKACIPF